MLHSLHDIIMCVRVGWTLAHLQAWTKVSDSPEHTRSRKEKQSNTEETWDWISCDFRIRGGEEELARMEMKVYREPQDPEGGGKCVCERRVEWREGAFCFPLKTDQRRVRDG